MTSTTTPRGDDSMELNPVDQQNPQPEEDIPPTDVNTTTVGDGDEDTIITPSDNNNTTATQEEATSSGDGVVDESNATNANAPPTVAAADEEVIPDTEGGSKQEVADGVEKDVTSTVEAPGRAENDSVTSDSESVTSPTPAAIADGEEDTTPPAPTAATTDPTTTPPKEEEEPLSHATAAYDTQQNATLVNGGDDEQTPRRPSPLPPRPASSSRRRPGSATSTTHNNNSDSSPSSTTKNQQRGRISSNNTTSHHHSGGVGQKGGSKIRARFVVEDPEKVCGMHVEQCDKRIELLQKRIADLEEMERKGATKIATMSALNNGKSIDHSASFASLSTMSPYGGQPRGWRPKAQISADQEGRMVERLTRPKQEIEHEEIPIGNRFRSREDEDNAPIDELDDDERAARIQEMVERLAGDDVSMRAANREERLEREAPNAPQEQWKGVVATLREGRRRFNRIMKGGADDEEEEEEDFDEDDEDGEGPFRLSIERQEALAQRLCNESLHKKQEGVKELTKKFYGDDVARRKDGVLGDHYQATGMCLPYEVGTIAAKTSKSPYRRYGGMPSLGPSSGAGGGHVNNNASSTSIGASKRLNTSSPFGEDASHTTPLRHNNNNNASSHASSSPVAVGGKLPPLLSPVVVRRLQREKKAGSPERKPTPAELGKRLHDDSRAHYRETQKELENKYLVNPLTRATQFADAGATGSSVIEKPLKYITPSQVKALGDRLCQPVSRGPK